MCLVTVILSFSFWVLSIRGSVRLLQATVENIMKEKMPKKGGRWWFSWRGRNNSSKSVCLHYCIWEIIVNLIKGKVLPDLSKDILTSRRFANIMYIIRACKSKYSWVTVICAATGISIRPDWRWRGVYKNRNCEQVKVKPNVLHLEKQNNGSHSLTVTLCTNVFMNKSCEFLHKDSVCVMYIWLVRGL